MRIAAILFLVGFFFSASATQTQSTDDAGELHKIESEIARLEQQNDTAIANFLADDWVCACARELSKKEFIQNVKQNSKLPENGINRYTIERKNLKVYVFRDTAVVTYTKEYRQTQDKTKFFDEDHTDVFTRDASGWHLHLSRISPVPQAGSS